VSGSDVVLLDGPIGTMLAHLGVPTPPPLWSASALQTHPQVIAQLHSDYAAAGATIHTAATFRTQPRHAGSRAAELTSRAVQLARDAVPSHHRVAGSMAPLEDCYRPDLSPPSSEDEHRVFAQLLARQGVDLLLVETFPNVVEALAATRAAKTTGLPVWTALTPGYEGRLMTPSTLAEGALLAMEAGAERVLVNCLPAAQAGPWVDALASTGIPWGIYANAGAPGDGLTHGQEGAPTRYAVLAKRWIQRGARVVGGCCGTGPEHISAIKPTGTSEHRKT
jgi:S-methylmethionine-dependent homocysteine/selenocysteine methylase